MKGHDLPNGAETFADYRQTDLSLRAGLGKIREFASSLGLAETVERVDEALARTERNFAVAIVGEFKRGKSTLINALLGRAVLPADVLPCSATLNRIRHSTKRYVELQFKDANVPPARLEIERLEDYVTKLTPEAEERAAEVREAVVYYPIEYCRNAEIIDTPGLNDDENMTAVTTSILPQVDAAVLVIQATAPFSEYEGRFLADRLMMNQIGRVIFVVTWIDQVAPEDRRRLIESIERRIRTTIERRAGHLFGADKVAFELFVKRIGQPQVYPLSARQGLEAKLAGDAELLEQSGFARFERALERFILDGSGAVRLQILADCTVWAGHDVAARIAMQQSGLDAERKQWEAVYAQTTAELEELRRKHTEEIQRIAAAAAAAKAGLSPLLDAFLGQLTVAATAAVDAVGEKASLLSNKEELSNHMWGAVKEATDQAARRQAEVIHIQIQRAIEGEIERLGSFAEEVRERLGQIDVRFAELRATTSEAKPQSAEMLAALPAMLVGVGWGGIWSGYREAGAKGALVGGSVGLGAAVGVGTVAVFLGVSALWPLMILMGVTSIVAGGLGTRVLLAKERIENWKAESKQSLVARIEEQWQTNRPQVEAQFAQQTDAAFHALSAHVDSMLGGPIRQTLQTLEDVRAKRERSGAQSEFQAREFAEMLREAEGIRSKALALSEYLRAPSIGAEPSDDPCAPLPTSAV